MANDTPPSKEAPAAEAPAAPASAGRKKLAILVGGIMAIEGVGVFAAMKFLGSGPAPSAAETIKVEEVKERPLHEIEVCKIRAPNVKEGRLILWSLEVAIRASAPEGHEGHDSHEAKAEGNGEEGGHGEKAEGAGSSESDMLAKVVHEQDRTIKDRLASIVRAAEPQHLQEDGLATMRRQIKFELERILGEKLTIHEVLIPECTPYPTGF